jgi:hypothetical protein
MTFNSYKVYGMADQVAAHLKPQQHGEYGQPATLKAVVSQMWLVMEKKG